METLPERAPLILVVDDTEDARDMYGFGLLFEGFRVETACNGGEAVAKATRLHPDAIVMDLMMPGITGWDATRLLKQDPRTENIPVLALTASQEPESRFKAWDAGVQAFLTKPCEPRVLAGEVRRLLESRPSA